MMYGLNCMNVDLSNKLNPLALSVFQSVAKKNVSNGCGFSLKSPTHSIQNCSAISLRVSGLLSTLAGMNLCLIVGAILLFANGVAAQGETAGVKNPAAIVQQVAGAQQKESVSAVPHAQKEGDKKSQRDELSVKGEEKLKKLVNSWCSLALAQQGLSKGTDVTPITLADLEASWGKNAGKVHRSSVDDVRLGSFFVNLKLEELIKHLEKKSGDFSEGTAEKSAAEFSLQLAKDIRSLIAEKQLDKNLVTLVGRLTLSGAFGLGKEKVVDPVLPQEVPALLENYALVLQKKILSTELPPFIAEALVRITLNSVYEALAVGPISKEELEKALLQQIEGLNVPLGVLSLVIQNLEKVAKEAEKVQ